MSKVQKSFLLLAVAVTFSATWFFCHVSLSLAVQYPQMVVLLMPALTQAVLKTVWLWMWLPVVIFLGAYVVCRNRKTAGVIVFAVTAVCCMGLFLVWVAVVYMPCFYLCNCFWDDFGRALVSVLQGNWQAENVCAAIADGYADMPGGGE